MRNKGPGPTPPQTTKEERRSCGCQASLHGLLTNCLSCGRILCQQEGPGPCFFCGSNVESAAQQLRVLRVEQAKRRAIEAPETNVGSLENKHSDSQSLVNDQDEALAKALSQTARLLTLDREGGDASNPGVNKKKKPFKSLIDRATDFEEQAQDRWSSAQERAIALRRAQIVRDRMESLSTRAQVLSLDIADDGQRMVLRENTKEGKMQDSDHSSDFDDATEWEQGPSEEDGRRFRAVKEAETARMAGIKQRPGITRHPDIDPLRGPKFLLPQRQREQLQEKAHSHRVKSKRGG